MTSLRHPDDDREPHGTRCRLFAQTPVAEAVEELEMVWLSPPAGSVGPGPSDQRMYVIDPVDKPIAYGQSVAAFGSPILSMPPWSGPLHPPAMPDRAGHLDHIPLGTPEFEAAHVYGAVRYAMDIWEGYLGGPFAWHFDRNHDRLEIVLLRHMANATAGYGYMEIGTVMTEDGLLSPFSLNFDVLAHEVGHLLLFGILGLPDPDRPDGEYYGLHESVADIVSLISSLHFDSVVDQLLDQTSGNLYTFNRLARFAELSTSEQIRLADNRARMVDYADGWHDEHHLAQPVTGAMFDILVDIFHENLLDRGLVTGEVEDLADLLQRDDSAQHIIQSLFDDAYQGQPEGFKEALIDARDDVGFALAATWTELDAAGLSYAAFSEQFLETDRELNGGRYQRLISNSLDWRQIGMIPPGPRLSPPDECSHMFSPRTMGPAGLARW